MNGMDSCGMNAFGMDDSLCEWDENLTVSGWLKYGR